MASDHEDDLSSRLQSDSSADETDSQDSDSMARLTDAGGVRRKSNNGSGKKASGEPHREKRKKAKRACRPCQVAHLTCDGVRKKAKYLADTPAEALTQDLGTRGRPPVSNPQNFIARSTMSDLPGGISRPPYGGHPYGLYPSTGQSSQPITPLSASAPSYGNPPGVMAPNYSLGSGPQSLPLQGYNGTLQQNPAAGSESLSGEFNGDMFAPFDSNYLDNLNFENRFAAAEFGMLGTMSSGIVNSPPSEGTGHFHSGLGTFTPNTAFSSSAQSPIDSQTHYAQTQGASHSKVKYESGVSKPMLQSQDTQDKVIKMEAPAALAIGSSAYPSPSSGSSPQGTTGGREDTSIAKDTFTNINKQLQYQARQEPPSRQQQPPTSAASISTTTPTPTDQTKPIRRHRNPSEVYSNVTQPYSYTAGFHSLTALIQSRFSPRKTSHIAKALAAIRPSFISCTMRLNRDDLIFMEKCLQRTLWGLEEVISSTGTPTIICRRTGEVVAAGKEFSILTGWSKDVLLGKSPNLNINKGGEISGLPGTGASSRGGQETPRATEQRSDVSINIVNLLDDESACDFFDDYAHLAFGDSRGAVTTPCKLLKYKTAENINLEGRFDDFGTTKNRGERPNVAGATGDTGMPSRGKDDRTVSCMLCWTVKRDVFDIPMLFVMNVRTIVQ
ncbi:uncharacterized protein KY384_002610 [Bacidia gigantensis]|uniref:uncharacterized protein n=1 Tax=Bacidia gigantensis TaxID=2732470 RepID=UPI001D044B44|nr:uncharacterized protein KY384_002610 [Bacidia gigantensis]KAG8532733.1 hypothetical protein KY384_002610 [Bacidia gigantensis]